MTSTVEVNDQGIKLSFIDSGPPDSQIYPTLVAIHGYGWDSGVFRKVLLEARAKDIRFIALNRRDFPGSTPFSQEELAKLKSPDVGKSALLDFMRARGLELIGFIYNIIGLLNLPTRLASGEGAISILGWSSGGIYLLSAMGCFNDTDLSIPQKETIKHCIPSCILFDPPLDVCGSRSTDKYTSPLEQLYIENCDPSDPTGHLKGMKAIYDHVSGWFQYDHSSADVTREQFILAGEHPIRPSTIEAAPDANELKNILYEAALGSENLIMPGIATGAFKIIALYILDKANRLKDVEGKSAQSPFVGVGEEDLVADTKIGWLWCENAHWPCVYNAHLHRKVYEFDGSDPNRKMLAIPHANHFLQWEDPKKFLDYVLQLL